ncbi:hypothetical protein [Roseateles sp. LYH14W]|uniref:Uncharacterized protein n=1 Tax=Pelomonas parva TaxID=3299032 RepID=A0ABW7F837_9BURK
MSRQQLKRWVAPLWASLSQALGAPAVGLSIQAHLPAHRPASAQPGVQA